MFYIKNIWDLFTKVVPKVEKKAPVLSKAETKAKVLKAKRAVLKSVHSHKKRSACHPPSSGPRQCSSGGSTNILRRASLGETSLANITSSSSSDHRLYLEEQRRQNTVFIVHVKANKHLIKQAVKKLYNTDVVKIHILIRPDRKKKTYVYLAPD